MANIGDGIKDGMEGVDINFVRWIVGVDIIFCMVDSGNGYYILYGG